MKRLMLALAAVAMLAGPALAGGKADVFRGIEAAKKGDDEKALYYFTRALAAGDLSRKSKATVHMNRGVILQNLGRLDEALDDYNRAIKMRPKYPTTYFNRGNLLRALGRYEEAIDDYGKSIQMIPDFVFGYKERGKAKFFIGDFAGAEKDLSVWAGKNPADANANIWLFLARARAGRDGRGALAANAGRIDRSKWPGPFVDVFLGKATPEDLAPPPGGKSDAAVKRTCEYHFYLGEYYLLQGDRERAARMFRHAIDTGAIKYVECTGARTELAHLGA